MHEIEAYQGKTAFVTGAASGIGQALSRKLIEWGAFVYGVDINESGLFAMEENLGPAFAALPVNVTDPQALAEGMDQVILQKGSLDYVFNNAGIVVGGATDQMDFAIWKKICDINLWSVIFGSQLAYQRMRKQGSGCIVNTASVAGLVPVPNSCAYSTTKHGVVGLSLSLAQEAKAHGIRVCVLVPGLVDTNIFSQAINLQDYDYARSVQTSPVKKSNPSTIAAAFLRKIARGKTIIAEPLSSRLVTFLYRLAPLLIIKLIAKEM